MTQKELDAHIRQSLEGSDYRVYFWLLIAIAIAVVVLLIRLYVKEWREKRGFTLRERERRERMAKQQELLASSDPAGGPQDARIHSPCDRTRVLKVPITGGDGESAERQHPG